MCKRKRERKGGNREREGKRWMGRKMRRKREKRKNRSECVKDQHFQDLVFQ